MSTVIDELIVVLGLDPRKFTQGQREALDAFKKTREGARQFGNDLDAQFVKISDLFSTVKKGVLGVVGGFVGNEAAQFIKRVGDMDAATGRWAKTINTSIPNLSTWEGMIRQIGGQAGSATAALDAMQQELNAIRFTGKAPDSSLVALANMAGINLRTDDADSVYRKAQSYIENELKAGRMTPDKAKTWLNFLPGMNQDMINLMTDNFKKIEESAKSVGRAVEESAKAGQELQKTGSLIAQYWESVARRVLPAAGKIAGGINKILSSGHFGAPGSIVDRLGRWMTGRGDDSAMQDAKDRLREGLSAKAGRASAAEREAWIRQTAASLGIDPDTAMKVAKSEGFDSYKSTYPGEQSFGNFQLNMNRGSMGEAFQRATGLDPRDPRNERAMDRYALEQAAKGGWSPFHGAARVGISNWQGIGAAARAGGDGRTVTVQQNNTFNIRSTDPHGAAVEVGQHIKRQDVVVGADTGLN